MLERLKNLEVRYKEIEEKLCEPSLIDDLSRYKELAKERAELEAIIERYKDYKKVNQELEDIHKLLREEKDEEFRDFLSSEQKRLNVVKEKLVKDLKLMLLPKDPNEGKNIIMEIRAGTGGEEASLFAADLYRMYIRYAEAKNWKHEIMSVNATELGGFKEIIFSIQGNDVYTHLKFESGVHRVQRVPITEAGGRIHTSTATVAVLPEAEEFEVVINENDLRIDTYRASGAGGQHVNKTDSAVRITHIPTGIVIACQDERSQHQNKEKALRILRAHLLKMMQKKQEEEIAKERKAQVGSGERSEKIRTYNFPQSRITDHRIGLSVHNLEEVLNGALDPITNELIIHEQQEKLKLAS